MGRPAPAGFGGTADAAAVRESGLRAAVYGRERPAKMVFHENLRKPHESRPAPVPQERPKVTVAKAGIDAHFFTYSLPRVHPTLGVDHVS